MSKATKNLNLSEDIFAGMDAQLRGKTIVHRDYFQVGKGRDMGCVCHCHIAFRSSPRAVPLPLPRELERLASRVSIICVLPCTSFQLACRRKACVTIIEVRRSGWPYSASATCRAQAFRSFSSSRSCRRALLR